MKKTYDKRRIIISIIFGIIIAFVFCLYSEFIYFKAQTDIDMNYARVIFYTITLSVFIIFFLNIFLKYFESIKTKIIESKIAKFFDDKLCGDKKTFILLFVVMLIVWIPVYLALFPGYYAYDAEAQIDQFFSGCLTAIQPITHTFILIGLIKLGNLLGNSNIWLVLYSSVQGLLVIITFSYVGTFLIKKKVPVIIVLLGLIYLLINPFVQILSFTTTKDVIFSLFLILFLIFTIDLLETDNFSKRKLLRYTVISIGMCLFRSQGIYIFTIIAILLLIMKRKKSIILISGIVIVFIYVVNGPITSLLNIEKIPKREMLSVPLQQIARVYNFSPESITDEEKEILYKYISEEALQSYLPEISDPVKAEFNEEAFAENKIDFFKVYISIGIKNIETYIEAFLYQTVGYFSMDTDVITPYSQIVPYSTSEFADVEQNSLFPAYYNSLIDLTTTDLIASNKLVFAIFSIAFPVWITIFCFIVELQRNRKETIIGILIILIYIATLLLGPAYLVRYAYPLWLCIPILISIPFWNKNEQSNKVN